MVIVSRIRKLLLKFLGLNIDDDYARKIEVGGGKIGTNVHFFGCVIDLLCPRLISIGNDVTLTGVTLLTHDASLKKLTGYSRFGKVRIGNMVFVGKNSTILPNVSIGDNVIVGAGSIVTRDIPSNSVAVGNPCRVIGSFEEYVLKNKTMMQNNTIDKLPKDLSESELEDAYHRIERIGCVFLK